MNVNKNRAPKKDLHSATSIQLRKILTLPIFQGYRVYAGRDNLDNMVSRITILEVPDASDWLVGGDLICTTGYILSQNSDIQTQWIQRVAQGGAAAIIIKPERFLGSIPDRMIEAANSCHLPLIGVPLDVIWSLVIQEVMDLFLDQQVQKLEDSYAIHHRLEKLVLSSLGTRSLLEELSQIVGCVVEMDDKYGNFVDAVSPFEIDPQVRESARRARLKELNSVPNGQVTETGCHRWWLAGSQENGGISQIRIPIIAGQHDFGWLVAYPVEAGQRDFIRTAIEHGSTAIALEMLVQFNSIENKNEQIRLFCQAMMSDEGLSRTEIIQYGQMLGVDMGGQTIIIEVSCSPMISSNFFHRCISLIKEYSKNSLIEQMDQSLLILYHPMAEKIDAVNAECRKLCYSIIQTLEIGCYVCHVGVSQPFSIFSCPDFRRAYREAKICTSFAAQKNDTLLFFSEIGIAKLFSFLENEQIFADHANKVIAPLIKQDEILVDTLQCYISNGFNKSKAAKQLCIHINTFNYRLDKINQLLGLDGSCVDDYLYAYIAITARSYYKKNEPPAEFPPSKTALPAEQQTNRSLSE